MAENENNNADFESDTWDTHPTLRPDKSLTRAEFVDKVKNLADELLADHEEHTGVSDTETHDWEYWSTELTNAYLNS